MHSTSSLEHSQLDGESEHIHYCGCPQDTGRKDADELAKSLEEKAKTEGEKGEDKKEGESPKKE